MRKMKKTILFFLATILTCTALGSFNSTAASGVLYGDINRDGTISISDSVCLSKFINGGCDIDDYTVADLNGNGVIDIVDNKILLMFLTGSVPSIPYYG